MSSVGHTIDCPSCKPRGGRGCRICNGRGWLFHSPTICPGPPTCDGEREPRDEGERNREQGNQH